jgi:hypothetical protein
MLKNTVGPIPYKLEATATYNDDEYDNTANPYISSNNLVFIHSSLKIEEFNTTFHYGSNNPATPTFLFPSRPVSWVLS